MKLLFAFAVFVLAQEGPVGAPPACVQFCIQENLNQGNVQCTNPGDMACYCTGTPVKYLQKCIETECKGDLKEKGHAFFKSSCKAADVDIDDYDPSQPLPAVEKAAAEEKEETKTSSDSSSGSAPTTTVSNSTSTDSNSTGTSGAKASASEGAASIAGFDFALLVLSALFI